MNKEIGWEFYRSFLGVLQEGSLSAAARALGVTQPTVGRHIAALEKGLKLTLFTRSQGGLLPTAAAQALRPHAEAMASTAAALERAAFSQNDGMHGVVRITASEVIGVEVLPSIIKGLRQSYPALKVELLVSNQVQDLLHREADIAVRMVRPRQTQLLARRLGQVMMGLHASQDYIDRHGCPDNPEELGRHSLIGFDRPNAFVRQLAKDLPGMEREQFALRSDNDLATLALIRAGAGIGFCQLPLAKRDANLVQVLPQQFGLALDVWVTMHEDLRHNPPCRTAFDALVAGLQGYLA
ncbi:LysR family transcriptional regulator [Shewanella sp. AS16]|uniref:LysR family transcriptional regulator n=1 Tax=Shewanella sp. AS16 TaxID=2907625 RepID=UPI001F3730D1|nr:LysR family transcriptional regulator [Shewanella sp. AS16]MCE9685020.1 LysR family transcriptional regulator [Shewanella sp. AS16]